MFKKILIANRGEIACRVIKTARKMGIDGGGLFRCRPHALHVRMADEAVHIGPPPASESYIVIDKIMEAIKATGARRCIRATGSCRRKPGCSPRRWRPPGVAFIGPPGRDRGDGRQDHLEEDRAGGGCQHGARAIWA
jgi:propionyl-CoA carboxylase alpha chain